MLYEASYASDLGLASPADLRTDSRLARYVRGWGRDGDLGILGGPTDGPLHGAAWIRVLTGDNAGYGHVDDDTPELAMAVIPYSRGSGLGTRLLTRLLADARRHHHQISLSVRANNPARRLYTRLGFTPVTNSQASEQNPKTSLTMLIRLR
jgi:ribosomal protein S18 acetylase RimI-like enzyme